MLEIFYIHNIIQNLETLNYKIREKMYKATSAAFGFWLMTGKKPPHSPQTNERNTDKTEISKVKNYNWSK